MTEFDTPSLECREVVSAFLRREGRLLLLRRSERVGSYRGSWSAISGYLEASTPLAQALREVREETGIGKDALSLVAAGQPLEVPAPELGLLWRVHPFLFELAEGAEPALDWENTELAWVTAEELAGMDAVPRLAEALAACEAAAAG